MNSGPSDLLLVKFGVLGPILVIFWSKSQFFEFVFPFFSKNFQFWPKMPQNDQKLPLFGHFLTKMTHFDLFLVILPVVGRCALGWLTCFKNQTFLVIAAKILKFFIYIDQKSTRIHIWVTTDHARTFRVIFPNLF